MKKRHYTGWILILTGSLIVAMALFVYYEAHTVYPGSDSSRVQDLNRLLRTFGRTGTSLLFGSIGLALVCAGIWKRKKQE